LTARIRRWLWAHPARAPLLVALLATVVFANTVHGSYVGYDTPWLVVENPLLNGGDLRNLPSIFWAMDTGTRLTLGAEYLPVRDLSVLLDFAFAGPQWAWHHGQNLLWYVISCVLFLGVMADLFGTRLRSFMGAALFAVHPVHVESVAWLASRKDVLSLALFLGALVLWRLRGRWRGFLGLSVLSFVLAYWAKNTAIVLPAFIALYSVLHERKRPWSWPLIRDLLPFAATAAAGLAITLSLGEVVGMFAVPRADSALGVMAVEAQVVLQYFGMLVWPGQLTTLYPEPSLTAVSDPAVQTALMGCISPLLIGVVLLPYRPRLALGIAWFYVALLPVSQIVPIQNLIADRYLLIPSAGAIVALAAALPDRDTRWDGPLFIGGALVAAVLSVMTWRQSATWHDTVSLWRPVVAHHPELQRGWVSLAGALGDAGRVRDADAVLTAGLGHHPGAPTLLQAQATLALDAGDPQGAEAGFRAALAADPTLRKSRNNLALVLMDQGNPAAAVPEAETLTRVHPLFPTGWQTLGMAQLQAGDLGGADAAFTQAQSLAPRDAEPAFRRGGIAWMQDRHEAAVAHWRHALELDPAHKGARRALDMAQRGAR
jgi:protein O-mannosyl-transferase